MSIHSFFFKNIQKRKSTHISFVFFNYAFVFAQSLCTFVRPERMRVLMPDCKPVVSFVKIVLMLFFVQNCIKSFLEFFTV